MLQRLRLLVCLIAAAATMAHGAFGATPEEAKAMAEKAALYLSENGEAKAFAAIDNPAGPFRQGDLYVFVHDTTGMVRAHGGYPALIGKNTVRLVDVDGKAFVKR
jgi:cytochrome c